MHYAVAATATIGETNAFFKRFLKTDKDGAEMKVELQVAAKLLALHLHSRTSLWLLHLRRHTLHERCRVHHWSPGLPLGCLLPCGREADIQWLQIRLNLHVARYGCVSLSADPAIHVYVQLRRIWSHWISLWLMLLKVLMWWRVVARWWLSRSESTHRLASSSLCSELRKKQPKIPTSLIHRVVKHSLIFHWFVHVYLYTSAPL